ncbi:MAG: peptidoglycan editing factor PgeF [Sinobacteraceae bacterium]|nr:peptidoglycan editing factor PgeF [Nevskiaceae bacterium]
MIPVLVPEWPAPVGVRAAFSLRSGGTSGSPWESLNVGAHVGDSPASVRVNRQRLVSALELPAEPIWLEQVHGTAVYTALEGDCGVDVGGVRPTADAAVTRAEDVVLAIQVADCLPVLLCSADGSVLGAAHAGWRGLAAGVLEATVEAMQTEPERLLAWFGPCIGPAHFEVGEEVREAFLRAGDSAAAFTPNPRGRWQCDLPALARRRLERLGVRSIHGGEHCTVADPVRFFSHRRDRQTGRMVALLWRSSVRI